MGHMAGSRSLYDILGIPRDASADAVRKAYKVKALQTHPDKLPPGARPSEVDAAQARFRDVCTAYDVLNDPAKRRVYDNGLNFVLQRVSTADFQAKLSRERAEWARQAELRHDERLRVLREEIRSSQNRYKANMEQAELKYQEKMRALEERLKSEREAELQEEKITRTYTLVDELLDELRRRQPEWEIRKQEVLRRKAERLKREENMRR